VVIEKSFNTPLPNSTMMPIRIYENQRFSEGKSFNNEKRVYFETVIWSINCETYV
jgi:hypothetical protein